MTDTITLVGTVGTEPRHVVTSEGLKITSFRFATTHRRFDTDTEKWIDGETNWYTITCFRQLAENVAHSVEKGDRLVVAGRLRIREWANDDKSGTSVELEAENIGLDLGRETVIIARSRKVDASASAA